MNSGNPRTALLAIKVAAKAGEILPGGTFLRSPDGRYFRVAIEVRDELNIYSFGPQDRSIPLQPVVRDGVRTDLQIPTVREEIEGKYIRASEAEAAQFRVPSFVIKSSWLLLYEMLKSKRTFGFSSSLRVDTVILRGGEGQASHEIDLSKLEAEFEQTEGHPDEATGDALIEVGSYLQRMGMKPGQGVLAELFGHVLEIELLSASAAGMEEKATPAAGLKALLEYVDQPIARDTIALLAETLTFAQSERFRAVNQDFPVLEGLAKEAGFAEGIAAIVRTAASGEAVLRVPAECAAQGIPIFVNKKWEGQVRQNLRKLEVTGRIRFVGSAANAFLVIGDDSISVRSDQVFIRANEETVFQVTPQLLAGLEERGLLKAGSVVMLYKPLKDSVLAFA